MTHTTGFLDGSPTLRWRLWRPDAPGGEVRASLALVHGIHEHSGRYAYVASRLMLRGIEVHAFDYRGHGESHGPRGQIEAFSEWLEDVDRFAERVRRTALAPVFLMGHSLGGLIAASWWASRQPTDWEGLILSSPALALPAVNPLLQAVAPHASRFLPRLRVTRLDPSHLSRDPRVGEAYLADPLNVCAGVQARTGYEVQQAGLALREHDARFSAPLYVFHGSDDAITDPEGSRRLADAAPGDDVTLKLWDGLRHETMNEPERDEVIDAVAEWVLARV